MERKKKKAKSGRGGVGEGEEPEEQEGGGGGGGGRGGGGGGDVGVGKKKRRMDRLRRSFRESFRRRKDHVPESSKPHQWQSDEAAVRSGTCNFYVKVIH